MTFAGRNRPTVQTVQRIGPLVERTVELCRTTFDRQIAVEAAYDPQSRACVDPVQLEQAVLNVLLNARDAVSSGTANPKIEVRVDVVRAGAAELPGQSGDHVRIRVTDNGVGMNAATTARMYEPFFTTKSVGQGTGLGLATTHAIVREQGGFITCRSAPGQGTTFSLFLPLNPGLDDGPAPEAPSPPLARGTETVLIVDDEAPVRTAVSSVLAGAGFATRLAASGDEAVALLADRAVAAQISLVLLDLSMPGMAPREVRERLRQLVPHACVVYFTGSAFDATGTDDVVLEKPASSALLLQTVRRELDRAAAKR